MEQAKNSHLVTLCMKLELYDRLTDFCEKSGQAKTVAIERALEEYIDDCDSNIEKIKQQTQFHNEIGMNCQQKSNLWGRISITSKSGAFLLFTPRSNCAFR